MTLPIERVEVYGVAMPLVQGFRNAYVTRSVQKSAVVRVTARGGAVGLGNIQLSSGSLPLPDGPGLGVELDDAKLAKYRFEVTRAA